MQQHTHTIPNTPTILVVFGATGDLMTKKIAPALYELFLENRLPKLFSIVGSSRRNMSDEDFRKHVRNILIKVEKEGTAETSTESIETKSNSDTIDKFLSKIYFHQAEFSNKKDYESLAEKLGKIDNEWQTCSNKLFYLAIPPNSYETLFQQLSSSGLTTPCSDSEGWTRVIVEKPFGSDSQSAEKLDLLLGSLFKEEQIYRIDHYLGKEMVQNILVFRFANNLFEQTWNNKNIESIDITLNEKLGVENRGNFYDKVGALRDVGQNHILQILALMTMGTPLSFESKEIRTKRAEVLETLPKLSEKEIIQSTSRYQHEGYKQIDGVKNDSQVETYFKLQFSLDHPRWKGVPITVRGGKKTGEIKKEILVTYTHPSPCLCPNGKHIKNKISFRFDTLEQISVSMWAKKAGITFDMEQKELSLKYDQTNKKQYTSEYEHLLLDCITGNQMLFVDTQEVKAMWNFIDQITNAWKKDLVPLQSYKADTLPE